VLIWHHEWTVVHFKVSGAQMQQEFVLDFHERLLIRKALEAYVCGSKLRKPDAEKLMRLEEQLKDADQVVLLGSNLASYVRESERG
jgi:hypothetical protein